jgi:hypothetical protein
MSYMSYLKVIKKKSLLLLLLLHQTNFFALILNLYIHIYIYIDIVDINMVSSANPEAFQFTAIRQLDDKKGWPIGFEDLINKNNVNLRLETNEYALLNYLIGILSICLISIINCL